jgi:coproporphyrinogen III oxidase
MGAMRTVSRSAEAATAIALIEDLQRRLTGRLEGLAHDGTRLTRVEWLRDGGRHGGGVRYEVKDLGPFNRASVNMSHVHYDDDDTRPLRSATALSSIIHPAHPRAPSLHLHISWTELRSGVGSWRIMADLNPSIPNDDDTNRFATDVVSAFVEHAGTAVAEDAIRQGERYFFIPALNRHRGVFHTYLESHHSDDADADLRLARTVGEVVIGSYANIVDDVLRTATPPTDTERQAQLAYHTAYLFQVLTLDRGTTSGLLVHDENDLGILGSLPGRIDRALLASWASLVPPVQKPLVDAIVGCLKDEYPCPVDTDARAALARATRAFYKANPEALVLQARGDIVPPTVQNHGR